ncbi:Wzz/FepE/Etk N-terminal domain-containing protein [Devosia sp.]|uniref:Wzz/FepE/Etk N-terminal domain-containing protein n=1 Tax=Devosia sp. TaxID=1871048 RepID=UPI003F702761
MSSDFERAEDVRMDVKALVAAVLSRGLRILLVTVLLLVATAAILLFVPKSYESSASLLVEPRNNIYTRAAMEAPSSGNVVNTEALMSSQIELIKSRDLLLEVVDSENLRSVPEFSNAGFSPVGFLLRLIGRAPEQRSVDETVLGNLADRMTVIRERDSAVISIFVRSTNSELAARIANAIAAAHIKRRAAQSLTDTADATVWLQQEIEKLRTQVKAAETAVAN